MRVTRTITKAQQTGLFTKGISFGAHPGMFRFAQHDNRWVIGVGDQLKSI